ncbi:MAG: phosphotransferase family protein [Ardenticatenaceae bacterium]
MKTTKGINESSVTEWLQEQIPTIAPPLSFSRITGGRSNLTYTVSDANGERYVLRRPPLGNVLESAHNVVREYRIVEGVGKSDVPVARTIAACEDKGVNGAHFTIVSYVEGIVLHDAAIASQLSEAERMALGFDVIEVLARLHLIEPDEVGLGKLGKRTDYVARQLRRWSRQLEAAKERDLPAMTEVRRRLESNIPTPPRASIVHGDYRLGNLIVKDARVQAVVDWEICTLGDPLADVGYLLNDWMEPGADVLWGSPPTTGGGFPSRDALLQRYASITGFDVSQINFYRAFAMWRMAAILEGVRIRYSHGAYGKTAFDLDVLADSVVKLAEGALALAQDT